MTINGGKPHAVGDRGQRYEVTFFNPATFSRQVLGWSSTMEGAQSMVDGINAHPAWEQPKIEDRNASIDTADHVHHAPSGEDWVVAYVRGDWVAWCGWPEGEAALADCTLLKKATPAERDNLLRVMAAIEQHDRRAIYARDRLGQAD